MQLKQFDHDRARDTARRLRERKPAKPLFIRDIQPSKDEPIIISSIGRGQ